MHAVYKYIHVPKTWARHLIAVLLAAVAGSSGAASFGYHGTLQDGGKPAQGNYDLELTLYSAETGGRAIGGPLLLYAVPVHDGSFSTQADFGALPDAAGTAWLGIRVRSAGSGEFVALSARSPVSADLTTSTTSVCPGAWTIGGNAGNPVGSYLGTADLQPLTLKVNGSQVAQFTPGNNNNLPESPNVVLGSSGNQIGAPQLNGIPTGDTISGGGTTVMNCGSDGLSWCVNSAPTEFGTIGGGLGNTVLGGESTIGGGSSNTANGTYATVPGGYLNSAGGAYSFAAGRKAVVRDAAAAGNAGDQGTFAWADSQDAYFTSTGNDQFIIRSQGGVAVNTTPPNHDVELTIQQSPLDVSGQASLFMRQNNATAGALLAAGGASGGNNNAAFYIYNYDPGAFGAPVVQELSLIGGNMTLAGTLTTNSDRRIKHDIAPIANAVDTLLRLQPVSFRYNADYLAQSGQPDKAHVGFVAQDYARIFPDAVMRTSQRVPGATPGDQPILALDPTPALITTVAAVQELAIDSRAQQADVVQLRAENAELRAALAELRTRIAALEHQGGE